MAWELPWATRGWTYQEAILSPKCLYISDYDVYMECNSLTYCETIDESRSPVHQKPHDKEFFKGENFIQQLSTGVLRSPLSANVNLDNNALRLYSPYTTIYTLRELSNQSDALHAFSGVLQALEKATYKSGFSWALPHEDFSWALLWHAYDGSWRKEEFPRWSWLSWRGRVFGGQPKEDGPQDPYRYPFDITIWKVNMSKCDKIFERKYADMECSDRESFVDDPLATPIQSAATSADVLKNVSERNRGTNGKILCVEGFTLSISVSSWTNEDSTEHGEYHYFTMRINEVRIYITIPGTSKLRYPKSRRGERKLLLLTRDVQPKDDNDEDWVVHNTLLLQRKGDMYERQHTVCLHIPRDSLRVLKESGLARESILLA